MFGEDEITLDQLKVILSKTTGRGSKYLVRFVGSGIDSSVFYDKDNDRVYLYKDGTRQAIDFSGYTNISYNDMCLHLWTEEESRKGEESYAYPDTLYILKYMNAADML